MRQKTIARYIAVIIGLAVIIITLISGAGIAFAAETTLSSNILDDLCVDGSGFKLSDYPYKQRDNSLNVFQVAESTTGELLIYVYQPSGQTAGLRASSINISRHKNDDDKTSFSNYKLEYLNSYDTLFKYRVKGFGVLDSKERIYNISNILRPFDKNIDNKVGSGNTVSEVENAVGQCWTATTENGSVTYSMTTSEVIEIKNKYVGYANYDDGYNLRWDLTSGATSAHFVAFSTDKRIDKLKSVELTFKECEVTYRYCANPAHVGGNVGWGHKTGDKFEYSYGEQHEHEPNPLIISETQTGSNTAGSYEWKRIQTTSEFLKNVPEDYKITQEGTGGLKNTQWVLSFYETQISNKAGNVWLPLVLAPVPLGPAIAAMFQADIDVKQTEVSEVTLLLLEFEKDGKTYRLGAVDNKQTGSGKPAIVPESPDFWEKLAEFFKTDMTFWNWLRQYWWTIPVGIAAVIVVCVIIKLLRWAFRKKEE